MIRRFALIGAPLLLITILYFRYIGFKLLPTYQTKNRPVNLDDEMVKWMDAYKIEDNYFRLRVRSGSPWIDSQLGDWKLKEDHDVSVIRIKREGIVTIGWHLQVSSQHDRHIIGVRAAPGDLMQAAKSISGRT